jgi:hypothetical protein
MRRRERRRREGAGSCGIEETGSLFYRTNPSHRRRRRRRARGLRRRRQCGKL